MSSAKQRTVFACLSTALLLFAARTTAATDAAATVRKLLGESFAAMQAAKSFRATSVMEQGGKKVTVQNDTIWPDRFHVRSEGREFIFVPGATWMKQAGGTWDLLPVDMSELVRSLSPDAMRQSLANLENAKLIGAETLGERESIVIEYDTHATVMGIATRSHVKVWLDAASKLPVKQQASGTAQGLESKTFTLYDFVSDLKIEAPR
ncbi:MAG: hypothetical protein ABIP49_06775 [Lysobacterales bacterium]